LQLLGLPPLLSRTQLCDDAAAAAAAAQNDDQRAGSGVATTAAPAAPGALTAPVASTDALPAVVPSTAVPSTAGPLAAAPPAFGDALMSEVTADDVHGAIDVPEEARMWEVTVQPAEER